MFERNLKSLNHLANEVYARSSIGPVDSFPENITVAVSSRCNYKCIMCAEWRRPEASDLPKQALDNLAPVLPFANSLYVTGGEPLLYEHLDYLFQLGRKAGCVLSMVTNGSLFTDQSLQMVFDNGLAKLKFSLDAATQKTYKKVRDGNLDRVFRNISRIVETKRHYGLKTPLLEVGYVAMRSNIGELPRFVVTAQNLGIDHIYVSYCRIHAEEMFDESLFLMQEESNRIMLTAAGVAKKIGMGLSLPPLFGASDGAPQTEFNRKDTVCFEPWRSMFVRHTGTITMCCGGGAATANILENDFASVWNHKARVATRVMVNSANPPAECRRCTTVKQNPDLPLCHFAQKEWQDKATALAEERRAAAPAA